MSALVASLFAVGVAPAHGDEIGAADSKAEPSNTTKKTACMGPAVADHGFTDLGTLEAAVPNINCLAYYGISAGKTADTFDPNSNVTRGQMALFLAAAAKLMGVDLMGGDMMADFGDIAELGENRRNAITSLARNGIMSGSGGNFRPHDDINRAEMAVALVALLDHTPGVGLSKATAGANRGLYVFGSTPGTGDLPGDHFADARRTQPAHIDNAISAAYELGITSGVGDGSSFDPSGSVPRRNMATFIARTLAHSNVRPAGLTAQLIEGDIIVSVRDAEFAPVLNEPIDAFVADVAHESRAFKADGTCSSRTTAVEGTTKCAIDGGDPVTQSDGNVTLARVEPGEGKTAWIWTGDLGDKVGTDTDPFEMSIPKGTATPVAATQAFVSNDLPKNPNAATTTDVTHVRFGRTVTVTIQLKGAGEGAAAKDAKPAADETIEYQVVTSTHSVNTDGTFVATAISQDTQKVKVDGDGKATFTVTAADPDARPGMANSLGVRYAITIPVGADGSTPTHDKAIAPATASTDDITFTDASPVVTYVSIENPGPQVAPGTTGTANAAVTIKVQDQYGDPFRGAPVFLNTSNANTGTGDTDGGSTIRTRALVTGASGTVRMTYTYTGNASQETLKAAWDGSTGGGSAATPPGTGTVGVVADVTDCAAGATVSSGQAEDKCGTTNVLWVLPSQAPADSTTRSILSLDAENSQIVVDVGTNEPNSINFDSNDFFIVTCTACGESNAAATRYMSMEDFVAELTKDLATAKGTTAEDQPTLTWAGYVHDDSSNITSFTMALGTGR